MNAPLKMFSTGSRHRDGGAHRTQAGDRDRLYGCFSRPRERQPVLDILPAFPRYHGLLGCLFFDRTP